MVAPTLYEPVTAPGDSRGRASVRPYGEGGDHWFDVAVGVDFKDSELATHVGTGVAPQVIAW